MISALSAAIPTEHVAAQEFLDEEHEGPLPMTTTITP